MILTGQAAEEERAGEQPIRLGILIADTMKKDGRLTAGRRGRTFAPAGAPAGDPLRLVPADARAAAGAPKKKPVQRAAAPETANPAELTVLTLERRLRDSGMSKAELARRQHWAERTVRRKLSHPEQLSQYEAGLFFSVLN